MGLFKRKARPEPSKAPTIFVAHEQSAILYTPAQTSRFFFVDTLIEPDRGEKSPDGSIVFRGMTFLPSKDAYMNLREQLKVVIHQDDDAQFSRMDLTRCYPHYIAIQWVPEMQPEDDLSTAAQRIEDEVIDILTEYFGWERPVVTGQFNSSRERFQMSQKLGVSWAAGNY